MWYIFNLYSFLTTHYQIEGFNRKISWSEWLLLQKYLDIFSTRFKYNGLEEQTELVTGFNSSIEMLMYFAPAIAWFEDSALGVQCLPVTRATNFNILGFPTEWECRGFNGFQTKPLNNKNSVIMPNDTAFSIPFLHVMYNTDFMNELDNTHRQNIHRQRQPLIMEIEEDEVKSANRFKHELDSFSDVIKMRVIDNKNKKGLDVNKTFNSHAYDSGAQFVGDKLSADYKVFENRIFEYFGYNNMNMEKKERLLVDEVNANNQVINGYYNVAYNSRNEAIQRVNKLFGTNITIEKTTEDFINAIRNSQQNNVLPSAGNVERGQGEI